MTINELFGKTITNIYATFGVEQEWLDTADCFIELDNSLVIAFPYGFSEGVWIRELDTNATVQTYSASVVHNSKVSLSLARLGRLGLDEVGRLVDPTKHLVTLWLELDLNPIL